MRYYDHVTKVLPPSTRQYGTSVRLCLNDPFAHALHHICIFTMFHAFGCVFYMLKSCVLIGLDWAKPMVFLLLHVICSCIFHAYVPFFSFSLILLLIGTLLCVSLSLFFG